MEGVFLGLLIGISVLLMLSTVLYWIWRTGQREHVLKVELNHTGFRGGSTPERIES